MIKKAKELLDKHGTLSVPFLMRNLKCTQAKATQLLELVCPEEPMDRELSLPEFIKKYRRTFAAPIKH